MGVWQRLAIAPQHVRIGDVATATKLDGENGILRLTPGAHEVPFVLIQKSVLVQISLVEGALLQAGRRFVFRQLAILVGIELRYRLFPAFNFGRCFSIAPGLP